MPKPEDDETRLVSALDGLPSRFEEGAPFGVFVFSEGRSAEPEGLEQVAEFYRALGVPIHLVRPGPRS